MFFFICGLFIFNAYCFRNGFIYIFFSYAHAFLVSGLCLKYDDKHKFRVDKVIYFLLIGFAMKAAIYFMEKLLEENRNGIGSMKIMSRGICLLLLVYLVLVYFLKKVPLKIVLPVSIIISLLAGYADFMGNFLCLSRFIVFFPFFFTGYCLSPEKVQNFLKRKFVRITGILSLLVLGVTFLILNDYVSPILRPVFYSRFPYSEMPFPKYGVLLRLLQYIIVTFAILGIGAIVSQKHIKFFSNAGSRTISVYTIHYFVIRILVAMNLNIILADHFSNLGFIIWLFIAVLLTCVLALPVFDLPFKFIQNTITWVINKLIKRLKRNNT